MRCSTLCRGNVAYRFGKVPVDGCGQEKAAPSQETHSEDGADLVWPNGYDGPVDREAFLAELTFERFGFKPRTSRRKVGDQGGTR